MENKNNRIINLQKSHLYDYLYQIFSTLKEYLLMLISIDFDQQVTRSQMWSILLMFNISNLLLTRVYYNMTSI